jgi:hypothetical protein
MSNQMSTSSTMNSGPVDLTPSVKSSNKRPSYQAIKPSHPFKKTRVVFDGVLIKGMDADKRRQIDEQSESDWQSESDDDYHPNIQEMDDETSNTEDGAQSLWTQPPPSPFTVDPVTKKRRQLVLIKLSPNHDMYKWSDGRHECTHKDLHSLDSTLVNSSCAVLSFFDGMFLNPTFPAIVCPVHRGLIPLEEMEQHISTQHKRAFGRCLHPLPQLLKHLQKAFITPPLLTQQAIVDRAADVELSEPIVGLPEPELCIQCPECCRWFVSVNGKKDSRCKNIGSHMRYGSPACRMWLEAQPRGFKLTSLPLVYAARLFAASHNRGLRVAFSANYKPVVFQTPLPTPSVPAVKHGTFHSPEYLKDFGWIQYIQDLHAVPSALIQLIALPSVRTTELWPGASEGCLIEEGLIVLYRFMAFYLEDANTRVNDSHDVVRAALVSGYVLHFECCCLCLFFIRSGAKFRRFQKRTFGKYRQPGTRMFTMVIRYLLLLKHRKTARLGKFKPKLTKVQYDLFVVLIAPIAHRILFSVFTMSMDARTKVDSAMEQSLILTMMTPDQDQWLSAQCLTQLFAQTQRTIFSTIFHTAWHGGINADFNLEDRTGEDNTNEFEGNDDESDNVQRETEEVEDGIQFEKFDIDVSQGYDMFNCNIFDMAGVGGQTDEDLAAGVEILDNREHDEIMKYVMLLLFCSRLIVVGS